MYYYYSFLVVKLDIPVKLAQVCHKFFTVSQQKFKSRGNCILAKALFNLPSISGMCSEACFRVSMFV